MGKTAKNAVVTADAKALRAWFLENPEFIPEGDKTVGPDTARRGRISAPAKTVFAEKSGMTFVEAQPKTVPLNWVHVQPSGKKVKKVAHLTPAEVRALVPNAPERGRLSEAHKVAAGEAYAEQTRAAREA